LTGPPPPPKNASLVPLCVSWNSTFCSPHLSSFRPGPHPFFFLKTPLILQERCFIHGPIVPSHKADFFPWFNVFPYLSLFFSIIPLAFFAPEDVFEKPFLEVSPPRKVSVPQPSLPLAPPGRHRILKKSLIILSPERRTPYPLWISPYKSFFCPPFQNPRVPPALRIDLTLSKEFPLQGMPEACSPHARNILRYFLLQLSRAMYTFRAELLCTFPLFSSPSLRPPVKVSPSLSSYP